MTSHLSEPQGRLFVDAAAFADFHGWHEQCTPLRAAGPIHRVELPGRDPFWVVLSHRHIMEVERQPELFTNEPGSTYAPQRPVPDPANPPAVKTLINMDGDEHRAHRSLVNEWFKPGRVRTLTAQVESRAKAAVDHLAALGGESDFAQDIAVQYPLQVILSILGLPDTDYARMLQLTQELFGADDPEYARERSEEALTEAVGEAGPHVNLEVIMDFVAYFQKLNADRRANPTGDLASVIANAQLHGEQLNDLSTFGFYLIVATAGHDTTSSAIGGGMLALLEHPDQLARAQADPTLLEHCADEIVRWVTPVKHFMRTAQADTELAGEKIAKGDWVMLSYQSANRDETVFEDPFRFELGRRDGDMSLGFGFGRHYCLGAHLAKLEINAFFQELIPRLDSIEMVGRRSNMHSNLVSGPKHLDIRYRFR